MHFIFSCYVQYSFRYQLVRMFLFQWLIWVIIASSCKKWFGNLYIANIRWLHGLLTCSGCCVVYETYKRFVGQGPTLELCVTNVLRGAVPIITLLYNRICRLTIDIFRYRHAQFLFLRVMPIILDSNDGNKGFSFVRDQSINQLIILVSWYFVNIVSIRYRIEIEKMISKHH